MGRAAWALAVEAPAVAPVGCATGTGVLLTGAVAVAARPGLAAGTLPATVVPEVVATATPGSGATGGGARAKLAGRHAKHVHPPRDARSSKVTPKQFCAVPR